MIKSITYEMAPLPVYITIHVASTLQELKEATGADFHKNVKAFCCTDDSGHIEICILKNSPMDHIVHECGHATFFALAYPGMEVYSTTGTHEMFCYYQQYLFNRCVEFQKKVRGTRDKRRTKKR